MKTLFINKNFAYDGTQLHSLFAYLNYSLMGNSIVSWIGPCNISFDHMVDGEDLLQQSPIRSDEMLHFIVEIFDESLFSGVLLQRLFASICMDEISQRTGEKFTRDGDDIYWKDKKLSISIASQSIRSIMIHFAINTTNEGTPVPTCALSDFGISPEEFSKVILDKFQKEFLSVKEATWKVRSL